MEEEKEAVHNFARLIFECKYQPLWLAPLPDSLPVASSVI
jgi:hypothetical protein